MSLLRRRVVKDTVIYTLANYIAMAIGILIGVATKAILGTVGAGYWALLKVFTSYGEYSDLGTRNAMNREIPRVMGAGKQEEALKTQDSAYAFMLLASFISSIVIAIIALTMQDAVLRKGLLICTALVIATQLYNFSLTLLRTLKKVGALSMVIIMNMVLVGIFSILGALWKGVLGMAVGVSIATFISAWNAYALGKMDFRIRWDSTEIRRLIRIGFPMVIISYGLVTFLSLDALMIGKMIGIEAVGLYTIGLMSVQQIGSLGRFSQIILLPYIQERYGQTGSLPQTAAMMLRATRVLAYLIPFFIALVIFFVPVLVVYFLPQFAGGIASMKILVIGYYFVAVNELSANAAFTADKQKQLIPFLIAVVAIAATLNFLFIRLGFGIQGVAAATSISYFLCFVFIFSFAFSRLVPFSQIRKAAAEILVLFAYFWLCVWAVDSVPLAMLSVLWGACLKFAAFCIFFFPAFYRMEKEEKLLGILRNLILRPAVIS